MSVSDSESLFHFQNIAIKLNDGNSKLETIFAQRIVGFIDSRIQKERGKELNNNTNDDEILNEHLFHLQTLRKHHLQKLEELNERNISDISNNIYSEAQFTSQTKCGLPSYNAIDINKFKNILENAQVEDFPPSQPPIQPPIAQVPNVTAPFNAAPFSEQKPKQNIFSSYANTSNAPRNNNKPVIAPKVNRPIKKEENIPEETEENPAPSIPPKKPATSLAARKPKNIDYGTIPSNKQPETEEGGEEGASSFISAKSKLIKDGNASQLNTNNANKPKQMKQTTIGSKTTKRKDAPKKDDEEEPSSKKPNNRTERDELIDTLMEEKAFAACERHMLETILSEMLDQKLNVTWDDIAGLESAKETVREVIINPIKRPDIYTGLRAPPKGLLLFGPPGTGKTLIGKAIASESKSTFFSISASTLTSKWIGEGEKMVRTMYALARHFQPSVIFIDEIDSLLTKRGDNENEASRRIKTEFLVQMDGAKGEQLNDRILLIGATNRPQELDDAARRRLVKKLYIPLPNLKSRKELVKKLLSKNKNVLTEEEVEVVAKRARGFSGADIDSLCKDAALVPLRSLSNIDDLDQNSLPPISFEHFDEAFKHVLPSVSIEDTQVYADWNNQFGTFKVPYEFD